MKLERAGPHKTVYPEVFKNVVIKNKVPALFCSIREQPNFNSTQMQGIDHNKNFVIFKFLLEVLVNDVRHSVRLDFPELITTERLVLHRSRYEDAEEMFYGYASKSEATRFVSWPTHHCIEDTRLHLLHVHRAWNDGTEFSFSVRDRRSYRLIGSFGLINDSGKVQFGYIINPSQWNKGFASEVCRSMMELLRQQERVCRVWTLVDTENTASIRVLLKSGLEEEVRLEKWMRFVNQGNVPKDCILFRLPI